MSALRIAAAQYPIEWLSDFAAYAGKITRWVEEAAVGGAKLLVFPEYGAMELASLGGAEIAGDLRRSIAHVDALLPEADALHAALAQKHGLHILAGSAPKRYADGRFRNVARFFGPDGARGAAAKHIMTRFEDEQWGIAGGERLTVFDTALGRIGVAICFDVEFPLLARALVEAGAEIILAPSCTDALKGYWRVRVGAAARALENQCYVIVSPTVGEAAWSPAVDANVGAAAVFAPPDGAFPDDGMVSAGALNAPQWVFADLDLGAVRDVRANGKVFNHRRWANQPGAAALPAPEIVKV